MEWKLPIDEVRNIRASYPHYDFFNTTTNTAREEVMIKAGGEAQAKKLGEWLLKVGEWAEDADYIPGKQRPKRELCIKEKYIKKLLKEAGVE
jgi:hypothetical protein